MTSRVFLPQPGQHAGSDGMFEYADGSTLPVTAFCVSESPDGCRVEADITDIRRPSAEQMRGDHPIRFRARTLDQSDLTLEGPCVLEHIGTGRGGPPWDVRYDCLGSLAVTRTVDAQPAANLVVRVELINLVFTGDEGNTYELGADGRPASGEAVTTRSHRLDAIRLTIEGRTIELVQALNYREVLSDIRRTNGRATTAQLSIGAADTSEIHSTILPIVQRICELLTFATGTHVEWETAHAWDHQHGRWPLRTRNMRPVRPYSGGPPLIDKRRPAEIRWFLESAYPAFAEHRERFQLAAVTHAYADGLAGAFLDTRALMTAVLGEFLATKTLAHRNMRQRLVSPGLGKLVRRSLQCLAEQLLRSEGPQRGLDDTGIEIAIETAQRKLQYILAPTLRERLRLAGLELGAGLDVPDINRFVDTRNDLAHYMAFTSKRGDSYDQYRAIRYVVDRLLLGLLRYRGPFVDCRNGQRSTFGAELDT